MIQSGTFEALRSPYRWLLNGRSFRDALRSFFPPIRNEDPRLDFYTIYKREVTQYDAEYVKKYDDDLNTTLIFVRPLPFVFSTFLTFPRSRVCSLLSVQHLSSPSSRASNPIRMTNPRLSSAPSSSHLTSPLSRTKQPPSPPSNKVLLPAGSSPSPCSCTRVF